MRFDRQRLDKRSKLELIFLSLPVALILAEGNTVLGFVIGAVHGTMRLVLIIPLCIIALLVALSAWLRQSRTGGYKRTARRLARAVTGAGWPLLSALGEVCRSDKADAAAARMVNLRYVTLTTARSQCGIKDTDQTRVSLYEVTAGGDLALTHWVGDPARQKPEPLLSKGAGPGRALANFIQDPVKVDRVDDIQKQTGHLLGPIDVGQPSYRSYIAVAVAIDSSRYGLLFVDSPSPVAFTDTDEGTLMLIAGTLAAGLAHTAAI
jgi:GAF domain-containing protein